MNLLFVATSYPPAIGGAQLTHHQLARQLSETHRVRAVSLWDENRSDWLIGTTLAAPARPRDYIIDGVPVHRVGLTTRDRLRMAPWVPLYYPLMRHAVPAIAAVLEPHLERQAGDAELIHNVRIGREPLSAAALSLARRRRIPFVITPVHHPRWKGWRQKSFVEIYRRADAVIALTPAERRIFVALGVARDRIAVTGVGPMLAEDADPQRFRDRHDVRGPLILFVGQHYPYKGFAELLAAAPSIWRRHPDAELCFVGPHIGRSRELFERAPDRRVKCLGQVDLQTKTDALAACTLLCVPSTQESFGAVYTEAWSFSKPVIGCPIPAVSEVIRHEHDGLLVPQRPPRIASAVVRLLDEPVWAEELGRRGRQVVDERYNWRRLSQLTEDAYRAALAR